MAAQPAQREGEGGVRRPAPLGEHPVPLVELGVHGVGHGLDGRETPAGRAPTRRVACSAASFVMKSRAVASRSAGSAMRENQLLADHPLGEHRLVLPVHAEHAGHRHWAVLQGQVHRCLAVQRPGILRVATDRSGRSARSSAPPCRRARTRSTYHASLRAPPGWRSASARRPPPTSSTHDTRSSGSATSGAHPNRTLPQERITRSAWSGRPSSVRAARPCRASRWAGGAARPRNPRSGGT